MDKKSGKKKAFTIIELLTVMSVIILLIGLLAPALQSFKRYAKRVKQKSQFHSIEVALDLFNAENEEYPPSAPLGENYNGAQKLCEALMGQDMLGFHPGSTFRIADNILYTSTAGTGHIRELKGPALQLDNANAHRMVDIITSLPKTNDPNYVLCDVYRTGTKEGMPILYYRADKTRYQPDGSDYVYYYTDNSAIVLLKQPPAEWDQSIFQKMILNHNVGGMPNWPHRADSYILHSAGFDGKYGTSDDLFNFERTDLGY